MESSRKRVKDISEESKKIAEKLKQTIHEAILSVILETTGTDLLKDFSYVGKTGDGKENMLHDFTVEKGEVLFKVFDGKATTTSSLNQFDKTCMGGHIFDEIYEEVKNKL